MTDDTFWLGFWIATILYVSGTALTLIAIETAKDINRAD